MMNQPTLFSFKALPASVRAALVGALGGLLAFWLGETMSDPGSQQLPALYGLGMGPLILAYDNAQSLRGRWYRDLVPSLFWFAVLGYSGGIAAEIVYSGAQNSLTRGLAWAIFGTGIGIGLGLLRRDAKQALRGALGGTIGGFIGGSIFNSLTAFSDTGDGALSRGVGIVITGAMIGCLIRLAQDTMRGAWLMGMTTGYEGKEYPLNKARVTVGRADNNDIALYRGSEINMQSGAFVFTERQWRWQGDSILINDVPQAHAALQPGDVIQLGAARFLFQTRATQSVGAPTAAALTGPATPAMPQGFAPLRTASHPAPPRSRADLQSWHGSNASPITWLLVGGPGSIILPPAPAILGVGRGELNEIILPDIAVSTRHARLEVVDEALSIIDLDSTNGTYVNGQRLTPQVVAHLRPNDKLRLGQLEYAVQVSQHG